MVAPAEARTHSKRNTSRSRRPPFAVTPRRPLGLRSAAAYIGGRSFRQSARCLRSLHLVATVAWCTNDVVGAALMLAYLDAPWQDACNAFGVSEFALRNFFSAVFLLADLICFVVLGPIHKGDEDVQHTRKECAAEDLILRIFAARSIRET